MELTKKAQDVLSKIKNGENINIMEEASEWSCSDGLWYGLTNGYIDPAKILIGEDLEKVNEAIKTLEKFESLWEDISYKE